MSSRTRFLVFLVSTPLVVLVVVGGLLGAARTAPQTGVRPLKVFEDAASLIFNYYVEDVNLDKVMDGAMRGLADGLDPASAYLTADEVKAIEANAPLPAGDVGLTLTKRFYLLVVGVRDNSPAQRAGLQTGDFIRAIGDSASRDLSALSGMRMLHGAPGSVVKLLVIRGNAADPHVIDLTREAPKTDRASSSKVATGESIVRVSSFGDGAAAAIRTAVSSLGAAANGGIVIDLRGTSDGTPEEGIAAARLFVKTGVLATRAGRKPEDKVVTSAAAGDGALTMPVILMVSNGTANAAEVFAAALADNKRATLVGEPTAGLAAVQRLIKLPEGQGLWMTYARYQLADGTTIHERGLRPDAAVEIPVAGFDELTPARRDPTAPTSSSPQRPGATTPEPDAVLARALVELHRRK
jgi:carboxyl-terminal processing protease